MSGAVRFITDWVHPAGMTTSRIPFGYHKKCYPNNGDLPTTPTIPTALDSPNHVYRLNSFPFADSAGNKDINQCRTASNILSCAGWWNNAVETINGELPRGTLYITVDWIIAAFWRYNAATPIFVSGTGIGYVTMYQWINGVRNAAPTQNAWQHYMMVLETGGDEVIEQQLHAQKNVTPNRKMDEYYLWYGLNANAPSLNDMDNLASELADGAVWLGTGNWIFR